MGIFDLNTHISNRLRRPLDDRKLAESLKRAVAKLESTPGADSLALARASASLRALRRRRRRVLSASSSGTLKSSYAEPPVPSPEHRKITCLADLDPRDTKILRQFSEAHAGHRVVLRRPNLPTTKIRKRRLSSSTQSQNQSVTGIVPRLECMPAEILELVFVYSRNLELPLVCRAIHNKLASGHHHHHHHHHRQPTPFSGKGLQLRMLRYVSVPVHEYVLDDTDKTVFEHFLTPHHHHHKKRPSPRALRAIDEQVLSLRFVTAQLLARAGIRFVLPSLDSDKSIRAISIPPDLENLGTRAVDLPHQVLTPTPGAKPAGLLSDRRLRLALYLLQFANYTMSLRDTEPGSGSKREAVSGPLLVSCIHTRDVGALHRLQNLTYTQTTTITTGEEEQAITTTTTTTQQLLNVKPDVLLMALQTHDTGIIRTVLAMAPSDTKNSDRIWAYILQTKSTAIKQLVFEAGGRPSLQALSRM
ncbi:uncharacterized protein SAPINGB_P006111 [Magnusiomyces paraingens]|uniref:Uncharacterized protein n=1 Tax=Magnusiomyces paraingens TaxID=2606893 RepID=A0A5E8C8H3_9ASCO|nr:uncharacterized protein SAPINGB_P006111 [Saprochaete ingens]VVT58248.1 unnamed protein product [Saprochaete ingens]